MTQVTVIGILLAAGSAGESPQPTVSAAPIARTTSMASRRPSSPVERSAGCIFGSMPALGQEHFVYNQSVNVEEYVHVAVSRIAAAIGEPARARMLYCLLDGHARTSTELAMVADVSPSTASVHLNRLKTERLVKVLMLEGLSVLAGGSRDKFAPNTPSRLRAARTCYDHMAGTLGVALHDRFQALGWLSAGSPGSGDAYHLTLSGAKAFEALGIDLDATRTLPGEP